MPKFFIISLIFHILLLSIIIGYIFFISNKNNLVTLDISLQAIEEEPKKPNVAKSSAAPKPPSLEQKKLDNNVKQTEKQKLDNAKLALPKIQQTTPKQELPNKISELKPKAETKQPNPPVAENKTPNIPSTPQAQKSNNINNSENIEELKENEILEEDIILDVLPQKVISNEKPPEEKPLEKFKLDNKALDFLKSLNAKDSNDDALEVADIFGDDSPLTGLEKAALQKQLSQCFASLDNFQEQTIIVHLKFTMNSDRSIKEIIPTDIINVTAEDKDILEKRIISLFNNPRCNSLILPENKFSFWKEFNVKLNIRGFFD